MVRLATSLLGSLLVLGCITVQSEPARVPPPGATAPVVEGPASIADMIGVCNELRSVDPGLACRTTYSGNTTVMMVVFGDTVRLEMYAPAVARYMGAPFCAAANAANRSGLLVIGVADSRTFTGYSCELGAWTDTYRLDDRGALVSHGW